MRYAVKWQDGDVVRYGVVYDKAVNGVVTVYDAVLPVSYEVRESILVDIEMKMGRYDFKTGEWSGQDEFHAFITSEHKKAVELSDSLPEGVFVGKAFSVGVGDGSAWYVVTKVGKRKCSVEWRGFCPDRYFAPVLGSGGSFAISSIRPMIRSFSLTPFR